MRFVGDAGQERHIFDADRPGCGNWKIRFSPWKAQFCRDFNPATNPAVYP
jgi:hypothetical protein